MFSVKKPEHDASAKGVVLLLQVPRTNEKKELAAEQMFASLNGLLQSAEVKLFGGSSTRERISFEIAVKTKRIGFYVWVPQYLKDYVEEQIYAQYPTVIISEAEDYALDDQAYSAHLTAELKLSGAQPLPIKTFPSFEVDPLAAITATLAQFDEGEEAYIQVVIKPASERWYKQSEKFVNSIRNGQSTNARQILTMFSGSPAAQGDKPKLAEYQIARANAAEEKSHKLAYEVNIRLVYLGNDSAKAQMRMKAMIASFKQFNTTYLNGFTQKSIKTDRSLVDSYRQRTIYGGFVLNIEEVASLYHLPHTNVETPNILWANSKTAEPPANLPTIDASHLKISPIATTNFRGHNTPFGLNYSDRDRHLYIIGQTGVGKSALLELLTISDINNRIGFAVVDPHGDYALSILSRIPEDRVADVVYFNPADIAYPIAFNPMEVYDDHLKTHTCSELIGVLKRMFDSWGPRLEYILRYSILALLDYPDSTMLDITRILTDKKFRTEVLNYVNDPVVRNFWLVEFASWNDRFATEAVAPVLNKIGAFTANPIVRNIIGQPKSSFNIRSIMDEQKILIVNLSRGLIGDDNASLLGALLVTKIQMAAMSRANIPQEQRIPFNLYVDEFQNFATDSFSVILSEARKYALNLTVANQYIAQMTQGVRDAVFGNVGSIVAFRMGADDAIAMQRYFAPHFIDQDLVHMHNRHFVLNMTIDGEKVPPFSGVTLDLPTAAFNYSDAIIANSRRLHSIERSHIELQMQDRYSDGKSSPKPVARPKPAPSVEQAPTHKTHELQTSMLYMGKVLQERSQITGANGLAQQAQLPADDPPRPKRKRRRNRKKKSNSISLTQTTTNEETVIRLR